MIKPMLCEKTTESEIKWFGENWKANIKYDGERIIAVKKNGEIFLFNRRGRLKNTFYAEVVEDLQKIPHDFIIDGEVMTYDDNFNLLQKRALTSNPIKQKEVREEIPVVYMVFDMLSLYNEDITKMPLMDRVNRLEHFIDYTKFKSIGFFTYEDIEVVLQRAKEENREGIIIKNMNSTYEQKRSSNWVKLKFFKTTELILQSYTINNAGIRCEDKNGIAVQVAGNQSKAVKDDIDKLGYSEIIVQYLEKTKENKLRFPSFIKRKNG